MGYPFETTIPLEKRIWKDIAQILLNSEGYPNVKIILEPGPWYRSKQMGETWVRKILDDFFGQRTINAYGTHIVYFNSKGKKVDEEIHLATGESDTLIFDTLLHEIAHVIDGSGMHNESWLSEYKRLTDKYFRLQLHEWFTILSSPRTLDTAAAIKYGL